MMKKIALVLGVVVLSIISITTISLSFKPSVSAESSGLPIDIWWPNDNAHVSGTLPFKALLTDTAVESYEMYWQVDGGDLVSMASDYADYPHKEANVDVSAWQWRGSGPYLINFVAKQDGKEVGQHSINIYIDSAAEPSPAIALSEQPDASSETVQTTALTAPVNTNITIHPRQLSAGSIEVWWPTPGTVVSGVQPFKAVLQNAEVQNYRMFWRVDGGALNEMPSNYTEAPHKEANVDVSAWQWQGTGNYTLTFLAQDLAGNVFATQSQAITVTPPAGQTPAVADRQKNLLMSISEGQSGTALLGMKLYVNPNSSAARQASEWRSNRSSDAAAMDVLASQPTAAWFGDWNANIYEDVRSLVSAATAAGAAPVMVAYNIPGRDCGSYSAGGVAADKYASWIESVASAIGNANAIIILEPDALSQLSCLSQKDQQNRLQLLAAAVKTLKKNGNTRVYVDAGHSGWIDADTMASRLKSAGVAAADGFALNVSNFMPTTDETNYGSQLSSKIGGKHFVIDTGRNGLGSNGEWCNPAGRAIGTKPTGSTGNTLVDAYLWIKTPGESDGSCNGGPSAGTWWPDYALSLVRNAQ